MDFLGLASTATTTLAALLKKHPAIEQLQNDLIQGLVEWVRPLFIKDTSPLDDLKNKPDSPANQQEVAAKIAKHLENSPESAPRLEELIKKIMDSGELSHSGNTNSISNSGDNNQIFQGINSSTITVNK